MKRLILISLVFAILISACTVQQIAVINGEETTMHELVGEKKLSELVTVENPENYFYKLEGDRESVISYEEFSAGTILADGSLSFDTVMCECADMKVHTITVLEKMVVVKDGREYVVQDDPKTTVQFYVTKTPELYEYLVNGETVSFEELTPSERIEVIQPTDTLEIKVRGDQTSFLFKETPYYDAIREISEYPEDYSCTINGMNCTNQTRGQAELIRERIHIKRGSVETEGILSGITPLSIFAELEGKEDLSFKLVTSDGFTPPPIGWEDYKTIRWNPDTQSTESDTLSKKYHLRDLEWIEIMSEQAEVEAIMIEEVIGNLEVIEYEGEDAVSLLGFITDIESPQGYRYRIIAADGYSPEPFSYEDMEQGYILLQETQTLFPHKNVGKNRIRNADKIELVA